MSDVTVRLTRKEMHLEPVVFYRRLWFMGGAGLTLSAIIIFCFSHPSEMRAASTISNAMVASLVSLLPYLMSAAVAAITAIGITTILPLLRLTGPADDIIDRLRLLADGDFSARIHPRDGDYHFRSLIGEVNQSITRVGNYIAEWKLVNRGQWEVLEQIRQTAIANDDTQTLQLVEQMENNWEKIARIEQRLIT